MKNWLRKAATWIKELFVKKAPIESSAVILAPLKKVPSLEKKARESLALGPSELRDKISQKIEQFKCEHNPVITKQVWVKVAQSKFELQNQLTCVKCKEQNILPIR